MTQEKEYQLHNMNELQLKPTAEDIHNYLSSPGVIIEAQKGRMCGDGRYLESHGRIARFGGDGGYVLGLLSLNHEYDLGLTPEKVVDVVFETSIQMGDKLYAHTDDHADDNDPYSIGCGHLGKAALEENEEAYGVRAKDVKSSIKRIKELQKEHPDQVEITRLEGEHKENAVLFNKGTEKKIEHRRGDTEFFVVGTTRDREYIKEIWPHLLEKIPSLQKKGITEEQFEFVLNKQTLATARILAPGFPIFEVNFSENNGFNVQQAGFVEPKPMDHN